MSDDDLGWFGVTGTIVGYLAAVVTFIAVYIAAVASVGWVIGIALGWIPATLAFGVAFLVGRYLWWLLALAILLIVWTALYDH
jgi:hypothetical protein